MDNEYQNNKPRKLFCPLLNDMCKDNCRWLMPDNRCAIVAISTYLEKYLIKQRK